MYIFIYDILVLLYCFMFKNKLLYRMCICLPVPSTSKEPALTTGYSWQLGLINVGILKQGSLNYLFWGGIIRPNMRNNPGSDRILHANRNKKLLAGGFKYVLFSPLLEEDDPILTNMFQMGWNHQLDYLFLWRSSCNANVFGHFEGLPLEHMAGLKDPDDGSIFHFPFPECVIFGSFHSESY